MKKITKEAISTVYARRTLRKGNTIVETNKNKVGLMTTYLSLYNNAIIKLDDKDDLYITSAGWKTNTTKECLNGLPSVQVQQKAGIWYLNGEEWNGEWVRV